MNPLSNLIAENKELLIYEDKLISVIFSPNPLVEGHVIVFPKKACNDVSELSKDELLHLFNTSNLMASLLFQAMGNNPENGTNIIINEGQNPDNEYGMFYINIIPRKKDDNLKLNWPMKQAPPDKLDSIAKRINEETFYMKHSEDKETQNLEPEKKIINSGKKKVNYMLKQLERRP
jgi:histidine triad (HIT) family protein